MVADIPSTFDRDCPAEKETQLVTILAVLELVPQIHERQAMLEVLGSVAERIKANPKCVSCGVFEEATAPQRVVYTEEWRSAEDLHAHIRSALYLRILNAVELSREPPKVSFHEVTKTRSMELIESLRSRKVNLAG
jgi:quinol monooxygenase YgiN